MSSGTEVGPEVEEEVEYVEEIVYEEEDADEEDEEEQEEEESNAEQEVPEPSDKPAEGKEESKEEEPAQPISPITDETEHPSVREPEGGETAAIAPSTSTSGDGAAQTGTEDVDKPDSVSSGAADAPTAGVELPGVDLKQLEAQATKVALEVSQVAKDMSSKLTAGLRSAFGSAEQSAAGASLTKLTSGLSSWWGSLDPVPAPVRDETAERVAASNKASGELQQLFGLSPEENLVEHFKCKLLQTYACNHNSHTPAIQMAFQGTLYVTDRHTCFSVEERGRKVPFKVPHSSVVKATRQRPARKGDLSDILKMELSSGQWLAFKDFDSGSALDSALALVEHLMEGH